MKHISKILLIGVLCMLFSQTGFSQETKADFANVNWFLMEDGRIRFTYDLVKASPQELFEIVLEFEIVESGQIFTPKTTEGDIGPNIQGGRGKEIYWDFWTDYPDGLSAEGVEDPSYQPRLTIAKVERVYAGPGAAVKSVFVPGLGDFAVKNHKDMIFKPYLKPILAYGLVGAGVYQAMNANSKYDDYLDSENPDDFQALYDQTLSAATTSVVLIGAGAAIWLSDIVWVAIVGSKNKKENQYRFTGKIDQKVLMGYDQFGPNLKLVIRF
jgi:hypothetical protein